MKYASKLLASGSVFVIALSSSVFAADLAQPEFVEPPVFQAPEQVPAAVSGWYIRGDVGYNWNKFGKATYITDGLGGTNVLNGELKKSFSVGAGVGYQLTHDARVDATLDYDFKSNFTGSTVGTCKFATALSAGVDGVLGTADDVFTGACSSSDLASFTAITALANAYVDLGTYKGITPYVGAGIGGARVTWSSLANTSCDTATPTNCLPTTTHAGSSDWRFAYAVMAGASYAVNKNLSLDIGYRYKKIQGGHMFGYADGAGPGYDSGLTQHQVRAGLRYKFGGSSRHPLYASNAAYK